VVLKSLSDPQIYFLDSSLYITASKQGMEFQVFITFTKVNVCKVFVRNCGQILLLCCQGVGDRTG
jgi:hypothetical protein